MTALTRDELRAAGAALAERTCAEQGIPVTVEDPDVIAQLRRIFRPQGVAAGVRACGEPTGAAAPERRSA